MDAKTGWPKGVGAPAQRALESNGVMCLDDVTRLSERELLALHGVGPKAVAVIKAALHEQGKMLRGTS